MTKRFAVMASGGGSIFKAILKANIPVELLITDRECGAIEIAKEAGVDHIMIPRVSGEKCKHVAHTYEIMKTLHDHEIELVALAGYMTLFMPQMFEAGGFAGKILNTHPSLLPSFKGGNAVADAWNYGVKITGCTIHFVTAEMDSGPIVEQGAVIVMPDDDIESLHERIKVTERRLYPEVIRRYL